jgi:uncharacterized protein YkwD
VLERSVFDLVNAERRQRQLRELDWSEELAGEARHHSRRMVEMWFFSHVDPERGGLGARLKEDHIRCRRCAENIYSEQGYRDPARQAVESWLKSPGHRASMLDATFTATGVGVSIRVDGTVIVTQEFARF